LFSPDEIEITLIKLGDGRAIRVTHLPTGVFVEAATTEAIARRTQELIRELEAKLASSS
jgi:protein subunit release factor A